MNAKLTTSELATEQRWQERYDEPVLSSIVFLANEEFVQIGDETFSIKDLNEQAVKHPQPKSHPFKPHHYLTQIELDIILAASKRGLRV